MRIPCPKMLVLFRTLPYCEFCRRPVRVACDTAHIFACGAGDGGRMDIPANLVSLGRAFDCGCHTNNHNARVPRTHDLVKVVAARWNVGADEVLAELHRALNQVKKGQVYVCRFTGWEWSAANPVDPPWPDLEALHAAGRRGAPGPGTPGLAPLQSRPSQWSDF